MRSFSCPVCDHPVFFHNSECLNCGSLLGFDPEARTMAIADDRNVRCANAELASCNWWVQPDGLHGGLCRSCRLTRTRPSDDDPDALVAFAGAESAKRRLLFQLFELELPVELPDGSTCAGLAFDLLSSRFGQVLIGHEDGLITIDLAETDDAHRERVREEMGEQYRTVLGHFRHEIGHYYWSALVEGDPRRVTTFRSLFGDETQDYGSALDRHHSQGPPVDWADRYVSRYATMHPWEDWAETFAHYLHIRDGLQTATSFGLHSSGPGGSVAGAASLDGRRSEPTGAESANELVGQWLALTYALNAMSRSLGNDDLYPFVLAPVVVDKLQMVHSIVVGSDQRTVERGSSR